MVHVGPGLEVRGGVSAVERLLLHGLQDRAVVEHLATMEDRSLVIKLMVFLRALRSLRSMLRRREVTVFHVHFASRGSTLRKCLISMLVLRTHHKLVLHAHGAAFDLFYRGLPKMVRRRVAAVFRAADQFIVLSSQWRRFYVDELGMDPRRVRVLINPARLPENVPQRATHDAVTFLFLGRIGLRKGAFELLEAYSDLPAHLRAGTRLVFAGDGDVMELRRLAATVGPDVTVHAWVSGAERDNLLESSDVLVLPSHQEGVPMAVLEGMAYGLPIIATAVGGIPDVISDGEEGILVGVGDRPGLTTALERLATEHEVRRRMGKAARTRATAYDESHSADQLMEIYCDVLARR